MAKREEELDQKIQKMQKNLYLIRYLLRDELQAARSHYGDPEAYQPLEELLVEVDEYVSKNPES